MKCIFCNHDLLEGKITDGWYMKEFYYSTTDELDFPTLFHNPNCSKEIMISKDKEAYTISYFGSGKMDADQDYYINHIDPDSCATICGKQVNDRKIPLPKTEDEFWKICQEYNPAAKKALVNFK